MPPELDAEFLALSLRRGELQPPTCLAPRRSAASRYHPSATMIYCRLKARVRFEADEKALYTDLASKDRSNLATFDVTPSASETVARCHSRNNYSRTLFFRSKHTMFALINAAATFIKQCLENKFPFKR